MDRTAKSASRAKARRVELVTRHILLAWELGANRGHATLLAALAEALRRRGDKVSFALQRVDALGADCVRGANVWPVPVSPRLLASSRSAGPRTHSLGDIMARLGCDDSDLVAGLLRAWNALLEAIRPHAIIANYAPFLLTAARGRVPCVSVGTWFNTPPSEMARFPSLDGQVASFDEEAISSVVNRALRMSGLQPLVSLPGLFAATAEIAAAITEFDRYATWRTRPLALPMMSGGLPPLASGTGDEIFVYMPEQFGPDAPIWTGLAGAGLKVRVHADNLSAALASKLVGLKMAVERDPVPFARIAERSRMVVSHGGHGILCSAAMAGLPHLIYASDLEKHAHGELGDGLRAGRQTGAQLNLVRHRRADSRTGRR